MRFSTAFLLTLLSCGAAIGQNPSSAQTNPPVSSTEEKDSIIVTGVYEPIPLDEADRAVRAMEIDGAQKLLSNTVFDFLRLDPSLDVQGRAPNGVQTDLSIRGGDFEQTLVLVDGIRMTDPQSGHHDMDIPLPPDAVGRVEILKGAGSAIYGSDAMGGVVNIITRAPESNQLDLRTGIGNFGVNQQSAALTTVWQDLTEQLSFSRDFSTGFTDDRDYRNLSFASLTHWHSSLGVTDVLLALRDSPFGANDFYGPYNSWERTKTWLAGLHQTFGKNTEASFAFRRHTDLYVLYRNDPSYYTNRHAAEGYQAALRRHNQLRQSMTLSYGGEGFRDAIASSNLGAHQRNYGAAYVALDVRALKRYSFTLGAREDIFGGGARQFNPTAAFGAWFTEHWKLRASASRAFHLPSYTDLYYHDPSNEGSPFLKPETAWGYDAAIEWNAGKRIHGDFGAFYQQERNQIDYVRASDEDVWQATNLNSLDFAGVEASVSIRPTPKQSIDVRYTAEHGTEGVLNGLQSEYVFNYPTQNAIVAWQAVLPAGFLARTRLGVLKRYQQDPYALWDLYVAWRHGRWSPFAQLTNLTATNYQEVQGVVMPGRAAVVGVDWKLGW
jgi:iron complex outermembrane receptor protein